jgi:hypothetical protein
VRSSLAVLAVVLIAIGIVMVVRHHDAPAPKPRLQQGGDTADLMRQLERKKLVTTTR